jgi:hypothetical protein
MKVCSACGHYVCRCGAVIATFEPEAPAIELEPIAAPLHFPRFTICEIPVYRGHAHGRHKGTRNKADSNVGRFLRANMHRGEGRS